MQGFIVGSQPDLVSNSKLTNIFVNFVGNTMLLLIAISSWILKIHTFS